MLVIMPSDDTFDRDTKRQFSWWAKFYDSALIRHLYFERLYRRIIVLVRHEASTILEQNATVLDVACGTGEIIARLAKAYPQAKFVGVDLTPAMVQKAQQKTVSLPNVEISEGNVTDLPYSDSSFDLVICSESFHHFANPKKALREIIRVSKVGGLLLLVDPGSPSTLVTRSIAAIAATFERNKKIYSRKELRHLLEGAGFQILSVTTHSFNSFFVSKKPG